MHMYTVRMVTKAKQRMSQTAVELDTQSITSEVFFERPEMIIHHIFWMSIFDGLTCIWLLFLWAPKIFSYTPFENNKYLCYAFGVFGQIATLGSITWYFIISWCLFITIFNLCQHIPFKLLTNYHTVVAWCIIILGTIIPALGEAYGAMEIDLDGNVLISSECWIKNADFWFTEYIPITFAWCFAVFVLLCVLIRYSCCSCCNYNLYCCCYTQMKNDYILGSGISTDNKNIVSRLSLFTMAFILTWSFSIIHRAFDWTSSSSTSTPHWIVYGHWILESMGGFINAYVWSKSGFFRPFHQTYQLMIDQKEQRELTSITKEMSEI